MLIPRMPELPEVQTIVNDLNRAGVAGMPITGINVTWRKSIATHSIKSLYDCLVTCSIRSITRRAKFIKMLLSNEMWLFVHLRMSGRIAVCNSNDAPDKHEHVTISFADGRDLRFHDTRKFGRWYLVAAPATIEAHLGPEPLDARFTPARFGTMLKQHNRQLKPLLLDQTFLAGLGNIYVDEALWQASLHPQTISSSLSARKSGKLHAAIVSVLTTGINNLGTSLGTGRANFYSIGKRQGRNKDQLNVFRRTGLACPRCVNSLIVRRVIAQRSTHICPKCQRRS
ncbi:MAG: DNA-formamidopyrimidine glycosylase [Chitinivibrionales bacterium]|nr:DNA-formamidopyrimidine glycosylase [Chitinivibrionales bacterium]